VLALAVGPLTGGFLSQHAEGLQAAASPWWTHGLHHHPRNARPVARGAAAGPRRRTQSRRRAQRPPSAAARRRFLDVAEVDLTPAFRATAAAWLAESEAHAGELARLEPPGAFAQRQADRRAMLAAIDAGLLCRGLLFARRR
jgi:hypothetical protein